MAHLGADELAAGLAAIRGAPAEAGTVEMIVRRPAEDEREVLGEGVLTIEDGLVGDYWRTRGGRTMRDGSADPERQLTLMSARAIDLLAAGDRGAWALAGDQLFVDLDLGVENLPAGTRLGIGTAVIQVSELPHTGCAKFSARFGSDALRFVNSPEGRSLRLRGLNARIVQPGIVRRGDAAIRL